MVWGAINCNFPSRVLIVHGNLTARGNVDEILRPELVPQLRHKRCPMIFQHDNACPHTARLIQDFLGQKGINVLPCPPKSQDLNMIKHLWGVLGLRVPRRQKIPQTLRQLSTALQQEWDSIP